MLRAKRTVSDLETKVAAAILEEVEMTRKVEDSKYTIGYMDGLSRAVKIFKAEADKLKEKAEASYDDKTIVVQMDGLFSQRHMDALRKDLLSQMEDGLIVIPGYAHVSYVGDACTVQIISESDVNAEEERRLKEE